MYGYFKTEDKHLSDYVLCFVLFFFSSIKTSDSESLDDRAIMVFIWMQEFSTSSQWHDVRYITGFNPPDTHQQTASPDKQLKRK